MMRERSTPDSALIDERIDDGTFMAFDADEALLECEQLALTALESDRSRLEALLYELERYRDLLQPVIDVDRIVLPGIDGELARCSHPLLFFRGEALFDPPLEERLTRLFEELYEELLIVHSEGFDDWQIFSYLTNYALWQGRQALLLQLGFLAIEIGYDHDPLFAAVALSLSIGDEPREHDIADFFYGLIVDRSRIRRTFRLSREKRVDSGSFADGSDRRPKLGAMAIHDGGGPLEIYLQAASSGFLDTEKMALRSLRRQAEHAPEQMETLFLALLQRGRSFAALRLPLEEPMRTRSALQIYWQSGKYLLYLGRLQLWRQPPAWCWYTLVYILHQFELLDRLDEWEQRLWPQGLDRLFSSILRRDFLEAIGRGERCRSHFYSQFHTDMIDMAQLAPDRSRARRLAERAEPLALERLSFQLGRLAQLGPLRFALDESGLPLRGRIGYLSGPALLYALSLREKYLAGRLPLRRERLYAALIEHHNHPALRHAAIERLYRRGDYQRARELALRLVDRFPEEAAFWYNLGKVLAALGEESADEAFARAGELDASIGVDEG